MNSKSPTLTKYPSASLQELFCVSFPLILVLLSSNFTGFCERLFLSRYSINALEAGINALYLTSLFQVPCIRVASTVQVCVAHAKGANQPEQIGRFIWQMIWFSLATMLITWPISYYAGALYFKGTPIEHVALPYFRLQMIANFLFPLGSTLSSFYVGQGKTKMIMGLTLFCQLFHLGLDYILIRGFSPIVPPLGLLGAGWGLITAQSIFCCVLFGLYLGKKNRLTVGTGKCGLRFDLLWKCVRIGLPRAASKFIVLSAWVATTRLMTIKGGDYLAVLSIGGSIHLLFSFITEGMSQGMVTLASHILGSRNWTLMRMLFRSAFSFLAIGIALLALPCIVYVDFFLSFFFSTPPSPELQMTLRTTCLWLWFHFLAHGINVSFLSVITASGDTLFQMLFNGVAAWVIAYLPVKLAIDKGAWSPDKFWLIAALSCLITGIAYFLRLKQGKWKKAQIV